MNTRTNMLSTLNECMAFFVFDKTILSLKFDRHSTLFGFIQVIHKCIQSKGIHYCQHMLINKLVNLEGGQCLASVTMSNHNEAYSIMIRFLSQYSPSWLAQQ